MNIRVTISIDLVNIETKCVGFCVIRFFVVRFWVIRSWSVMDWGMIRSGFWGMVWSGGRKVDRNRGVVRSGGRGVVRSWCWSVIWSWGVVWGWCMSLIRSWGMIRDLWIIREWGCLIWRYWGWGMNNGRSMMWLMYSMGDGWSMAKLNSSMATNIG